MEGDQPQKLKYNAERLKRPASFKEYFRNIDDFIWPQDLNHDF